MRRSAHLALSFSLASLAALLGCGPAEPPAPAPPSATAPIAVAPAEAPAAPRSAPLVWEVRHGERASYLLGTIHMGVTLDRALPGAHRTRLAEARAVVVEADPTGLDPAAALRASLLPPDQSLDRLVDAATWERLAASLGDQVPPATLARLEPWAASVTYVQSWLARNLPDAPSQAMDAVLIAEARSRNQRLVFLETVEAQLEMMAHLPDAFFVESLTELVSDPAEADRQIGGLVRAYERGDAEAIERLIFDPEDLRRSPEYFDRVFFRRNEAWLAELEPMLHEGGVFVAVGLGHLLGERGLLAKLAARGFSVERAR